MNDKANEFAQKKVIYEISDMEKIQIQSNLNYLPTEITKNHRFDIYLPQKSSIEKLYPTVIFLFGFTDPLFGKGLKDIGQYTSWGKLIAASGLAAITYTYEEPIKDFQILFEYLQENADLLGIDKNQIGIWACSGNVPMALSILMQEEIKKFIKCAVLYYGYMLDIEKSTIVAEAATKFGFVNPGVGKSLLNLSTHIPLFLIRSGQDQMPNINKNIDLFLSAALAHNLPISFLNLASAPHAFDLYDDSKIAREAIKNTLQFLQFYLMA